MFPHLSIYSIAYILRSQMYPIIMYVNPPIRNFPVKPVRDDEYVLFKSHIIIIRDSCRI